MEIRKVQITGGSSYVITLPKDWAEAQQIKKNDPLGLVAQPDGTLLVTRDITEGQFQREKKFDVSATDEPTFLFRMLIGSYIAGYTTITISSKTRISAPVRMVVRDFAQMTIGPEVVEETDTKIILKDLLNPVEMPFENTIKRMFVIVKNMHLDTMIALESRNRSLGDDVIARDNDVDRLHWLIARQTNIILKNASLARKMEVSTSKVVNTYIISRIIERIGDHAVRIAENTKKMPENQVDAEVLAAIKKANTLALSIFDKSIISFFNEDIRGSHNNIEHVEKLEEICENINILAMKKDPFVAVSLRYIAESIRRSGEYAGDISESVINYLVDEKV
ncbi:MAG: AbrB/MazE/SpoVT family DNA-binding domain-containing protein [Methanoregulaceae archaeon]|nr:AbrB/MazE/SpoVT family DNA-binding domain-containing protein [Methanoregulaceae archaeon]